MQCGPFEVTSLMSLGSGQRIGSTELAASPRQWSKATTVIVEVKGEQR